MESKNNIFDDDDDEIEKYKQEEEEEQQDQEEEEDHENNEILKSRISNHPLYGLLVETHLDCLKIGDISKMDRELKKEQQKQAMKKQNMFSQTELDLFMEAYCLALNKLKEAMEEPQEKSMAFINNMHSQLRELSMATTPASTESSAGSTTSSSDECTFRRNPTI